MTVLAYAAFAFMCGYAFAAGRAFVWKRRARAAETELAWRAKVGGFRAPVPPQPTCFTSQPFAPARSVESIRREGPANYSNIDEFAPRVEP